MTSLFAFCDNHDIPKNYNSIVSYFGILNLAPFVKETKESAKSIVFGETMIYDIVDKTTKKSPLAKFLSANYNINTDEATLESLYTTICQKLIEFNNFHWNALEPKETKTETLSDEERDALLNSEPDNPFA